MKTYLILLWILLVFQACDRPECISQNPIFNEYSPGSLEYQEELVQQMDKYEDLKYWLKEYHEESGKEYLVVYVQNSSLCAQAEIRVTDWTKIEGIRRTKGKSYRGAELRGLTIGIQGEGSSLELIYEGLDRIID